MIKNIVTSGVVGGILCCILPTAAVQAGDFNLSEVAPGVYVHQGVTVPFDHPQHDDIANIGFIVGTRCVAVIDTGGSLAIGRQLLAALRAVTDQPVCYVINTHVHPDHTLGNAALRDTGAHFVGHVNLPQAFVNNTAFFLSNFSKELEGADSAAVLIPPDTVVQDTLDLDLGGRMLHLQALPTAHTAQDLAVYDAATRTLWLGLLFVERIPALDGSLRGWIDVLHGWRATDAVLVIPGNGPLPAPWPAALAAQLGYLERLRDETQAVLDAGGFLEEALTTVGQDMRAQWLLFGQHHQSNVTRAYTELEWAQ